MNPAKNFVLKSHLGKFGFAFFPLKASEQSSSLLWRSCGQVGDLARSLGCHSLAVSSHPPPSTHTFWSWSESEYKMVCWMTQVYTWYREVNWLGEGWEALDHSKNDSPYMSKNVHHPCPSAKLLGLNWGSGIGRGSLFPAEVLGRMAQTPRASSFHRDLLAPFLSEPWPPGP